MKNKVAASIKPPTAKPQKTQAIRDRTKMSPKRIAAPQPKSGFAQDPSFAQAVQNYEAGLKAMQERKFERAKGYLEKVLASGPKELADRTRVHLSTCNQQLNDVSASFKTSEEHFDYAVSLINRAQYDQARQHLDKILKQNAKADFGFYGLAVVDCLTGQIESSLKNLGEAIRLNPQNRFQARNDSDFQNMADDPRFTELLYPEPTEQSPASGQKRY
jgi:tetratricopeptide (TPR) repeat protein